MAHAVETKNAAEMLREDHQRVKDIFDRFEQAEDASEKLRLVREALSELKIHASLEEEIFYPAVREETGEAEEEKVDEAIEEHHAAKLLMAELEEMQPDDERFDAKFCVLSEMVRHHIEEEESEMLPKAEESGLDMERLGQEMERRKAEFGESEAELSEEPQSRGRSRSRGRQSGRKSGRSKTAGRRRAASSRRR